MIRSLTKELQKIASEELNEDPELVEEDIRDIQRWINQQPHLSAPTDNQWILGFLRGCKFSHQTTKRKFDMFYAAKSLMPEIMRPRNILSVEIQTLLKAGTILPFPYTEESNGPRVILVKFENLDTSINNAESIAALFNMILNILMVEDDNLIVSGAIFWGDFTHFPLGLFLQVTPTLLKNFFFCLQNAFPIRIKRIHITGLPSFAEKLVNLIKVYMAPKLKRRLFVYSESKFENIFQGIPKSHLPKEYGGVNSSIEDITDYWMKKVESYSRWFQESDQYHTNESMRPGKPVSFNNAIGINGSFRKLSID